MPRRQIILFLFPLTVGLGVAAPATAQKAAPTPEPKTAPTIKKRPSALLPKLSPTARSEAKSFLRSDPKLRKAGTVLYLSLQKTQQAYVALQKAPTDKRLERTFVNHAMTTRTHARAYELLWANHGDGGEQGPNSGGTGGDSGGTGGGEQGPQGGMIANELVVSIGRDLERALSLTGTRRLRSLGSAQVRTLNRQLAIVGSRGDDLHAIIEPIM